MFDECPLGVEVDGWVSKEETQRLIKCAEFLALLQDALTWGMIHAWRLHPNMVAHEVVEIIRLPKFAFVDHNKALTDPNSVKLSPVVLEQLKVS